MIKKIILLTVIFSLQLAYSNAQMPDWTLVIDKDTNKYFIDKNGKIWTSGDVEFDYKPVTIEGIDYYLNQGIELINNHKKYEGLVLLKSILVMPSNNDAIYKAQIKSSNYINNLIKLEGDRFNLLNENASILLYKKYDDVILINDYMHYSLKIPANFNILAKRIRHNNEYYSYEIKIGIKFNQNSPDKNNEYKSFDLLIAIEGEKYKYSLKNVKSIEKHWRNILGADTFERNSILNNKDTIIYLYKDKYKPDYSGVEGFYLSKNKGYYIKTITSKELYLRYNDKIIEIVNSFKIY
jgi:hypothetical protein